MVTVIMSRADGKRDFIEALLASDGQSTLLQGMLFSMKYLYVPLVA